MGQTGSAILLLFATAALLLSGCALSVSRKKGIVYQSEHKLELSVFSPKKREKPAEVLVFVHGGNWRAGKKSIYNFFGKGMAKKGIVTVVIDYRLYPKTTYEGMASDVAGSIKWVKENIATYGGDPEKIFVSGHSAGAHLAALVSTDNSYFGKQGMKNPVKGCLLIDPFGLDMHTYLQGDSKYMREVYTSVFTGEKENWKKGSPVSYLNKDMPPFLLLVGGKTYSNIVNESNVFHGKLQKFRPETKLVTIPGKRHAPMIFQFMNPRSRAYKPVLEFIKEQKPVSSL